jgi:hypothetical protein
MSVTKLYILQEIKRTTKANRGTPLRKREFESKTGITRYDWFGVYWARWSDAVREAGSIKDQLQKLTRRFHTKPLRNQPIRTPRLLRLAQR